MPVRRNIAHGAGGEAVSPGAANQPNAVLCIIGRGSIRGSKESLRMSTQPVIPVALVDDHALFRGILADMINGLGGYQVVVEAGNGEEYQQAMVNGPQVAVAVVDLHMPVMDGYATIAWIRATSPNTRALALTFEKTEEAMMRALRAGACGFVLKDVHKSVFKNALDQVATVGHYYDDELFHVLTTNGQAKAHGDQEKTRTLEQLTDREAEFLCLVCHEAEYTYDQIADRMQVHRRTVDGYRESLFSKFNIKSKSGLVMFAMRWGVVKV